MGVKSRCPYCGRTNWEDEAARAVWKPCQFCRGEIQLVEGVANKRTMSHSTPSGQVIGHAAPLANPVEYAAAKVVMAHYQAAADLLLAGATRLAVHRQLAGRGLTFPQATKVVADLESYFSAAPVVASTAVVAAGVVAAQAGDSVWVDIFAEFVVGFVQGALEG